MEPIKTSYEYDTKWDKENIENPATKFSYGKKTDGSDKKVKNLITILIASLLIIITIGYWAGITIYKLGNKVMTLEQENQLLRSENEEYKLVYPESE